MKVRSKSRNPAGLLAAKSVTNPTVAGRSILLPYVAHTVSKKPRAVVQNTLKSPYERSALTPPNRSRPSNSEKQRPASNKKYVMLYSNLKRNHMAKLNDAIGLIQKPFDYSASFIKTKKPSVGSRKSTLIDKRMSVFSNTYAANKKKMVNDIDTYSLTDKSFFDLNKTVDMIVQNNLTSKFKAELSSYGNLIGDKTFGKKDSLVKEKPAAPEIKRKVVNPLSNINP